MKSRTERPCAALGYISYRYKGRYGWIMIGAKDDADALQQAALSVPHGMLVTPDNLQVWNNHAYTYVEVQS